MRSAISLAASAIVLTSVLAFAQSPTDQSKPKEESKTENSTPTLKWLQNGGYAELAKKTPRSTSPIWSASSFGKECREVDIPGGGKKKICDPPTGTPGTPPKISPCSEVTSCAPGVGMEGGVLSVPEKKIFDSLLHSEQDFKRLIIDTPNPGSTRTGQANGGVK